MNIQILHFGDVALEKSNEFVLVEIPVSQGIIKLIPTCRNRREVSRMNEFSMAYTVFLREEQF